MRALYLTHLSGNQMPINPMQMVSWGESVSGDVKFTRIYTGDGFRDVQETPAEVTRAFDAAVSEGAPVLRPRLRTVTNQR